MSANYTCKKCGTPMLARLNDHFVIVCSLCKGVVYTHPSIDVRFEPKPVPADWSFVQIGTEFQYADRAFVVVGRIRIQLRNDYKNLWCAVLPSGTFVWLMESFGSFAILTGTWETFQGKTNKLHAGSSVSLKKDLKVKGEYVEKCEEITFEGEVGEWKIVQKGFFFIQSSNNSHHTAIFLVNGRDDVFYLTGGKIDIEKLNLKNILAWDEWK